MTVWLDALVMLLALTNLGLLGSSRLRLCIQLVAVQGIVFGFAALLLHPGSLSVHLVLVTLVSAILKGIVFPHLLMGTVRDVNIRHEVEPFVGYSLSLMIGVVLLGPSVWLGARLPLSLSETGKLVASLGLFTTMVGLFVIVSRRKAITQVLGYLAMENGIFAFGITLVDRIPMLVELGVLMDVFVAVFVMGLATFHISREFDHIDTDQLNALKG